MKSLRIFAFVCSTVVAVPALAMDNADYTTGNPKSRWENAPCDFLKAARKDGTIFCIPAIAAQEEAAAPIPQVLNHRQALEMVSRGEAFSHDVEITIDTADDLSEVEEKGLDAAMEMIFNREKKVMEMNNQKDCNALLAADIPCRVTAQGTSLEELGLYR